MNQSIPRNPTLSLWKTIVLAVVCLFGLWMVVIVPLGPRLANIPGDIGDARLNNYLLEHFFRWISGLDKSFWNAEFFYPYPDAVAFSDNFLGSGIFYALFRWLGLDPETAFQGWYIWGYFLNYLAAAYVLSRLKFNPIGAAAGAFFFAFGLPVLAKESHVQLLYRFGVPLACLCLWRLSETPTMRTLLGMLFWTVWQFYLSIYTGVFLIFLLFSLTVCLPFFMQDRSFPGLLKFWPGLLKSMWANSTRRERLLAPVGVALLLLALAALLWPYYQATQLYGFTRQWSEVVTMLPTWVSYLIADRSLIWRPISQSIGNFPMRHEHNLFIGIPAVLCVLISMIWHRSQFNRKVVFLHVFAAILVVIFTSKMRGFSLYFALWHLPGLDSIRAITRIILILMWPVSMCIAYTIDQLLTRTNHNRALFSVVAFGLAIALLIEPVFFDFYKFIKIDSQKRIEALQSQVPSSLPDQPILLLAPNPNEPPLYADLDGMLLSQRLGWPSLNGYSGNRPPGYGLANSCRHIQQRILAYMDFADISSESYYLAMINRVVPIGFGDCSPMLKVRKPQIFAGPLPQVVFEGVTIEIISLQKVDPGIRAEVKVTNHSPLNLPSFSSTKNPVLVAWRLVNLDPGDEIPAFDAKKFLDNDIYPGENAIITIHVVPPESPGQYQLEVTAVQEQVDWFYNRGLPIAGSSQVIQVDALNNLTIESPSPSK